MLEITKLVLNNMFKDGITNKSFTEKVYFEKLNKQCLVFTIKLEFYGCVTNFGLINFA